MSGQWRFLPLWLGAACVVGGLVVIGALFWGSGAQATSMTQVPYVLVAGGVGVGLILFGAAVANGQRQRIERQELEDATARMLQAAARLAQAQGRQVGGRG